MLLYLVKVGNGSQVLSVFLWRSKAGIEFQTSHDVENRVFGKHELEEGVLVQEENVLEYVVQVVKALAIFQIFAHVKHVQKFLNVTLIL